MRKGRWRPWPIALACAYRMLAALVVAMPLSLAVARVVGHHPSGDALLWNDVWLLEIVRVLAPELEDGWTHAAAILLIAAFGWLLPLGALIASLGPAEPARMSGWLARGAARLGPLSLLLGLSWLLQALLGLACLWVAELCAAAVESQRTAAALRLGGVLLALLFAWLAGVIHDAVRVPLVQDELPLGEAIVRSGAALQTAATYAAAAWRTAVALTVWFGAAALGLVLARSAPWATLVVHQAAVVIAVLVRTSWLSWLSRRAPDGQRLALGGAAALSSTAR